MIIDRSHRAWFIGSLMTLGFGVLIYVPYARLSVPGVSGGSTLGIIYGGVGLAMMVFAGLLGARKKYRTWRVGRATWWMRAHLWVGFLSFPFILFHSGFTLGSGALTRILMIFFLMVFISGLFGAALQHFMPRIITDQVPMETIYEQIDRVVGQLIDEAAAIISEINQAIEQQINQDDEKDGSSLSAGRTAKRSVLAVSDERVSKKITMFFESQMKPYLLSARSRSHFLGNSIQTSIAFEQLKVLVPEALWSKFDDLESICEEKRQLENQRRLHNLLHGWLLLHVPASYALILLGVIHAVLALRY